MNIFFTAAIRGGRQNQPQYAKIAGLLNKYGNVLSTHIAEETMPGEGETDLTKEEIYQREIEFLHACDVVVAEVSTPSLGVGYLIGQAVTQNKKVVCLFHGNDEYVLSAMITGNKNVVVESYEDNQSLETALDKNLRF